MKNNLRKVICTPEISDLYCKVCELFSSLSKQISRSTEPSQLDSLVEKTMQSYILNHTQLILQMYCEEQEGIGKRVKKAAEGGEPETNFSNQYLSQLIQVCTVTFRYLSDHLTFRFEEFSELQKSTELGKEA